MSTDVRPFPCPSCKRHGTVKSHCANTVECGWLRCTSRACMAVIDPYRQRGFSVLGRFIFKSLEGPA